MKIGDEVFVHGYVDEIRNDVIIISNDGGYFGTVPTEIVESDGKEYKRGRLDALSELKAYIREMETYNTADTPQTFDKPPKCLGCVYSELDKAFHPCASCVDFSKYVGEVSADTPQTDCPYKEYPCDVCDAQTDCQW